MEFFRSLKFGSSIPTKMSIIYNSSFFSMVKLPDVFLLIEIVMTSTFKKNKRFQKGLTFFARNRHNWTKKTNCDPAMYQN